MEWKGKVLTVRPDCRELGNGRFSITARVRWTDTKGETHERPWPFKGSEPSKLLAEASCRREVQYLLDLDAIPEWW